MLYINSFTYIQPFIVISILSGVWGIIMCVRAAEAAGAKPKPRFLALQLVLLIVKLQCGFAKILPEIVNLPCILALHPSVFVHSKYIFSHIRLRRDTLVTSQNPTLYLFVTPRGDCAHYDLVYSRYYVYVFKILIQIFTSWRNAMVCGQ